MRALYQRKKGRDLFDLWLGCKTAGAEPKQVIGCFLHYMEQERRRISRAEFEQNFLEKLNDPRFIDDIGPLIIPGSGWDLEKATGFVLNELAVLIPGEPWQGKTKKHKKSTR